jgi:hypothetical protein
LRVWMIEFPENGAREPAQQVRMQCSLSD